MKNGLWHHQFKEASIRRHYLDKKTRDVRRPYGDGPSYRLSIDGSIRAKAIVKGSQQEAALHLLKLELIS